MMRFLIQNITSHGLKMGGSDGERSIAFLPCEARQMKFFMENFGSRTFGEIFRKFQLVGLLLLLVAFVVVVRVLFSRGILVLNLK